MATGEMYARLCWQRQDANRPKLIVDSKTAAAIENQIRRLQGERSALYDDLTLEDDELATLCGPIEEKIRILIDSMYEKK